MTWKPPLAGSEANSEVNLEESLAAKKKPVDTWSLADLGVDAAQVGLDAAWTRVVEATERPPRSAGEVVTDEGQGGVALADFLASRKFV